MTIRTVSRFFQELLHRQRSSSLTSQSQSLRSVSQPEIWKPLSSENRFKSYAKEPNVYVHIYCHVFFYGDLFCSHTVKLQSLELGMQR